MNSKVSVFVAGVQKCGTTALYVHLRDHPQMAAADAKETHFFDDEAVVDWAAPDYTQLERRYPLADYRIRFDATPAYIFWPPSIERIRRYNPQAKLIMLFRDPIQRAWSQWRMEHAKGKDTVPFGVAIREGRNRLRNIDPLDRRWRYYSYVERGLYAAQMDRLQRLFPREQLLLLRAEDLRGDTSRVLAAVADFLGINSFEDTATRIELSTGTTRTDNLPAPEDVDYLRPIFGDDTARFGQEWNLDVSSWLTMRTAEPSLER